MSSFVYGTEPDMITSGEKTKFRLNITNSLGEDIVLENRDCLKGAEYPALDDRPKPDDPVGFFVYFSYGDEEGDITQVKNSHNIRFSIIGNEEFDVFYNESPRKGSYWIIYPKSSRTIKKSRGLTVEIDNIAVNEIPGLAAIHILLKGGSFYEEECAKIIKKRRAIIKSFGPVQKEFDIGNKFTLCWELEKDYNCDVRLDGMIVIGIREKEVTARAGDGYLLQADNRAGYIAAKTYTPSYVYILSFEAAAYDGASGRVTLKWTSKNTEYCRISGIGQVPANGTCVYQMADSEEIVSFTLTALQMETRRECDTRKIEFARPVIDSFQVTYYRENEEAEELDMEGGEFISLEELENHKTCPVLLPPYYGPTPPGPKEYTVFSWKTRHTDYCSISNCEDRLGTEGTCYRYKRYDPQTFILTAYTKNGSYVQRNYVYTG